MIDRVRGCILKGLATVVVMGLCATASHAVDGRYSGSWFDPAKRGQGFTLQVLSAERALITWFTYDTEGNQAWMQGVGEIDGQRLIFDEMLRFTGPRFGEAYNPDDLRSEATGALEISFADCNTGVAHYRGSADFPDDTLALTRLTSIAGFGCDGPGKAQRFPLHHGVSGAWYAPAQNGQGWMVEVLNEREALVYWFTYDGDGQQRWMLGVGAIRNERIEVRDLQWTQGGRFGPDFDPDAVKQTSWGRVNLKLWPCRGAQADYIEGRAHLGRRGEFVDVVPLASIDGTESCPPYVDKWTAARLLDQAAFGATPADEKRVYRLGIEGWIEEQLAMRPSLLDNEDLKCYANYFDPETDKMLPTEYPFWEQVPIQVMDRFVGAPDQLRLRMTWALSQLLVISTRASDIQEIGAGAYFNMLQSEGLGNYRDILREATLSPAMGVFLDNNRSFAKSTDCPNCLPNENYPRELLMLFTLGVNQLNMDGTVKTAADGTPLETFSQQDVMELARAISGWRMRELNDYHNWQELKDSCASDLFYGWNGRMVPHNEASMHNWPRNAHDPGHKTLLGQAIPAGQGIRADLESVLDILMGHPNMAPFVSFRLIQHFTTSNPSPEYVRRVAEVFADNGQGVAGDMSAVVRAILLDPEARRGDDPQQLQANFGRIRDLVHHHAAVYRGMECSRMPTRAVESHDPMGWYQAKRSNPAWPRNRPFGAPEVFNFYPPDNPVPGMNLISPEHMLINVGGLEARLWSVPGDDRQLDVCGFEVFDSAVQAGPEAILDLLKSRYVRGRAQVDHEDFIADIARDVQGFMVSRKEWPENEGRHHLHPFTNLVGYFLLGEEFGVIR